MRLMAGGAAFKPHRRVFEGEGSALIAMALKQPVLVGARKVWAMAGRVLPCGIVAIDAGHRAFRHAMVKGFLKLSH